MLFGGDVWDHMEGNDGNDFMDGGDGGDFMEGGAGADTMSGGLGNDYIVGMSDNDILEGSVGVDTFKFRAGDGIDIVTDFTDETDILDFDGRVNAGNLGSILSQNGADALFTFGVGETVTLENFYASLITMIDIA